MMGDFLGGVSGVLFVKKRLAFRPIAFVMIVFFRDGG